MASMENTEGGGAMKFGEFNFIDISSVPAGVTALVDSLLDSKSPTPWREMAWLGCASLRSESAMSGVPDEEIARAAVAMVYHIVFNLGGRSFYLQKGDRLISEGRSALIRSEFKGQNIEQLARKHRLSTERVRNILKAKSSREKRGPGQVL